jgi:imidazolonepropionase-like amidohydrolase
MTRFAVLLATLTALACATRTAPAPERTTSSTAPDGALLLEHVTLVDGTGAPPRRDVSVLIEAGRVRAIVPAGATAAVRAERRDLTGHTVIPGLVDAHVHVTSPYATAPRRDSILALLFQGGVTTVRDMAGDAIVLARRAAAATDPRTPTPRILYSAVFAGERFFRTDRRTAPVAHGMRPGETPWLRSVSDSLDVPLAVDVARAMGVTGLKLYAELTAAQVARVTAEAHRQGLKVWSHAAVIPARPSDAVAAGVDVLSHADLLVIEGIDSVPTTLAGYSAARQYDRVAPSAPAVERVLRQMQERGTMLEPTLYVITRQAERARRDTLQRRLWTLDEWTYAVTRRAHALGIPIVAGTDLMGAAATDSLPYIHDELALLVQRAGLTPLEAIRAATLDGARALGVEKDYGSVEPGKVADLVVLRGDPSADIANTRRVAMIVKGGRVHMRDWPAALGVRGAPDG